MPQTKWLPSELFPKAELIAGRIGKDRDVTGMAVTGSLARLEPARDIDLVIFHNGALRDGFAQHPARLKEDQYDNDNLDFSLVPNYRDVIRIRGDVPLDLIFVQEKILWDCSYLKSLERSENFSEFYKRVFCSLPLLLIGIRRNSTLDKFIGDAPVNRPVNWPEINFGLSYPSCKIMHTCLNADCKPTVTWEQCRVEIEKRKANM